MYKKCIKRMIDFLFSLIALPFVGLAVIIISPIIWIDDHGPVFYIAERRGKDGKTFKMIKFRSMKVNAPDLRNVDGSTYNSPDDSRMTKVGKVIRKLSIDEVPQVINVFLGHMSIIGPRPTLAKKAFSELPSTYKKRYTVRPGITGYTQAYFRNSITQDEKFRLDCEYADKISFKLDVHIFFQTIKTVLLRKNIYVSSGTPEEASGEAVYSGDTAQHK